MTPRRTKIPSDLAADVMFAADRTCCVCHEPRRSVHIHHLDEDHSNNDPDNLAVVCLQCHDDTQLSGGFGRKLNANLVRRYRDDWYASVAARRAQQPDSGHAGPAPLAIERATLVPKPTGGDTEPPELLEFSFAPTSLDASRESRQVTVRARIRD